MVRDAHRRGYFFAAFLLSFALFMSPAAYGAAATRLQHRYDQLSNSAPGASSINVIGFTITDTSQALGSIKLEFCEQSPLPYDTCTAPPGLDASNASLSSQSGNTGFSIASNSTGNAIILTRSPSTPTTTPNVYTFNGIVNPSQQGAYYLRLYIYPTTDSSGPDTQNGGVALDATNVLSISTEVPPYLKFCAGLKISNFDCSSATSYVNHFGNFSSHATSTASSQFTVATNAVSGYTITATGPTLTSGNNVIANMATPTTSIIGAPQFGINLRANNQPVVGGDPIGPGVGTISANYAIPNHFMYQDGDTLVTATQPSDNQTFTVSYLVNVPSDQPIGSYVTTLTYICLANF